MSLLLDTHVLLWWLSDDERLAASMRTAISAEVSVSVSAVSAWEMSIKASLGKLTMPGDLSAQLADQGFEEIPVTIEDALLAGSLPRHHDDPFDRILIAQAARRDLVLLSADRRFSDYDVRLHDG